MHLLLPQRPGVIDAATGLPMPGAGVTRPVLLPPDHYAIRTGDLQAREPAMEPPKQAASEDAAIAAPAKEVSDPAPRGSSKKQAS